MPLILSWCWTEHCKKYWKGSEDRAASGISFVYRDEMGTVKINSEKKDEAELTDDLVTAINDGTTRPDENIIPVVDGDVVADGAFDVAAIDGAEDRGFTRIFGDEGDRDSRFRTHGEDLGR